MDYKKDDGIFLGVMDRSNTYIVGNKHGIFGSLHIMALPDDEAYDVDMAAEVNLKYVDFLKDGVKKPPSLIEASAPSKSKASIVTPRPLMMRVERSVRVTLLG